jgi:endonuclease/exonuclease/phosphatase family metal-dependent hydrolase
VGRETPLAAVVNDTDPEVVVLQEASRPEVVERLAAATGMKTWDASPRHSVGFMSRVDIAHHEWHWPRPASRSFLEIVVAGTGFRIFGVHLTPVHSNWTEARRVRELRGLLASIARHQEGFHVVAGDFNTLAPGEELDVAQLPYRLRAFIWLTGRTLRWRTIQLMLDAGYVDGYRRLHASEPGYTFPTWNPHVRLDYVFVPGPFADRLTASRVVTDPAPVVASASDHHPLLADLAV